MKFRELKERLLIAMLRHQRNVGYSAYIEPRDVANEANLSYAPGQIRLCVNDYESMGYIRTAFHMGGGEDGGLGCKLTASGIEAAEQLEEAYLNNGEIDEENGATSPTSTTIPASDRLVALNDNQEAFVEFQTNLSELVEALQSGTQETNISRDEILLLQGQLEAARRLVEASPIVTSAAIKSVLLPPLKFLLGIVVSGLLYDRAKAAFDFLTSFI